MEKPLGERIRTRRQLKGWTLKDLAEATELSVPYLSDLERRSGVNPTLDTLTTLATAFGCSVAELVGNDGSQATAPPPSLARFVRSGEFQREVKRLAERTKTSESDLEHRLIDFLAVAPRRSTGDLTSDDWRRLLDVFTLISDES